MKSFIKYIIYGICFGIFAVGLYFVCYENSDPDNTIAMNLFGAVLVFIGVVILLIVRNIEFLSRCTIVIAVMLMAWMYDKLHISTRLTKVSHAAVKKSGGYKSLYHIGKQFISLS